MIRLLTEQQNALFAYLVSLVGDFHEANDILQETNLVLCRRADEYEQARDFGALARRVAYLQTLAFLRDRKRDRHRFFSEELLHQLAEQPQPEVAEDQHRIAMRLCLAELRENHRELIAERYGSDRSIKELAQRRGQSESAIKMALARIRQSLLQCIEHRLAEEV